VSLITFLSHKTRRLEQKKTKQQTVHAMPFHRETTMNFQVDAFDRMENGTTFIGTEIFPAVLHSMLDEVEEKGYSHIVSWQPHGRWYVVMAKWTMLFE
jgi:hypothetical protein